MASPKVWAEIWKRPGHATFARQIADPGIITASGSLPVNGVGEGRITLPAGYARLDEIIKPARPTPSAAVSSLVRYFSESQAAPIFEWIPLEVSGLVDKNDSDIDIKGAGIDAILGYARVEAWDWTGIDDEHSNFPDWIWGGKNILGDLTAAYEPATLVFWTEADAGTFTIGVDVDGGGFQTTSALAITASAADVEAALIALSNVVDVNVNGSGTATDPWRVTAVDPEGVYAWILNTGALEGPWQILTSGATGGTFTVTVDGQTTVALAFNVSAATMKTEIEALSTVTTCDVTRLTTGSGFSWVVYFVTPDDVTTFTVADSLTPAAATVTASEIGDLHRNSSTIGILKPQGYTTSFNPVTNLPHGQVDEFRISTFTGSDPTAPACDTSGFAIMFNGNNNGGFLYPGIQKIVPVKPGGRYYATVTAYAQGAADSGRLVIRDLYENGIAASPDFTTGTTLPSNTWVTFDIPAIDIPDDIDRVIFRFASVSGANNPPNIFVTCLELREGMPPTTWGDIWTQLWLDATTDHAPGRVVWEAGTSNLPYLTLDFDAALDSAGAAWVDPEVSITLKRGQSYLRVRGEDAKMGYEGRIVPNNYLTGTYLFQLYNPGTMTTDHSLVSSGPSIQGGRDVGRRDLRRFLPPATNIAVEAGGQNIARAEDANAVTALGRIEAYQPDQDLGSLIEAATVADQSVTVNLARAQALSYVLIPQEADPEPFIDYIAGDTLFVLDPPDVNPREARRIKKLGIAFDKSTVQYSVQLESESFVGVGAIYEGVNVLLKEFKAIRDQPPEPTDILNYFADPCCPSCPANVVGLAPVMTSAFMSLDWQIDNDPDQIVAVDSGGNLTFRTAGLYSVHFSFEMRWTLSTLGITTWRLRSQAGGNDAGQDIKDWMSFRPTTGTTFIQTSFFHWAHLFDDGETYNFDWDLLTALSSGVVTAGTGILSRADLTIIRHGDGCAREQGSA